MSKPFEKSQHARRIVTRRGEVATRYHHFLRFVKNVYSGVHAQGAFVSRWGILIDGHTPNLGIGGLTGWNSLPLKWNLQAATT